MEIYNHFVWALDLLLCYHLSVVNSGKWHEESLCSNVTEFT